MIVVSRDATPVQVDRILNEMYSREARSRPLVTRRFCATLSAQNLRKKIVCRAPNKVNSISRSHVVCLSSGQKTLLNADKPIIPTSNSVCQQSAYSFVDNFESAASVQKDCTSMNRGLNYPVDLPLTSSKAIGWVLCPELRSTTRWRKPRVTGPVVKYAEIYYEQNRTNPFKHRSR